MPKELYTVTDDTTHKDVPMGMSRSEARQYYLEKWGNFKSRIERPVVEKFKDKWVLRADLAPGGLKAFGGERVIAETPYDTLVYCARGRATRLTPSRCWLPCTTRSACSSVQHLRRSQITRLRFSRIHT